MYQFFTSGKVWITKKSDKLSNIFRETTGHSLFGNHLFYQAHDDQQYTTTYTGCCNI